MDTRIIEIATEATSLFLKQGYAQTKISHVAKAVGVSVGTIYHDFTGKKEIADFILKCIISSEFARQKWDTPISNEQFIGLEEEIVEAFEVSATDFKMPLLSGNPEYYFENLVSDAFDLLAKYAVGCLFIEKNQLEFKFLAERYKKYRLNFFATMMEYLDSFIKKGMVRKIENLELTTVFIVEALSWWAMDSRYTSFEISNISLEMAKKVCSDNIVSAYQIAK